MPGDEGGPVTVARLGSDGDGIVPLPGGAALHLAGALPGELVEPGPRARRGKGFAAAATVLRASPDRVAPKCRHFGVCGGCAVQHLADGAYAAWKRGQVAAAVARLGFAGEVGALARTPPGARRRMDLAVRRGPDGVAIGLHGRRVAGGEAGVVDMQECPVLEPRLFRLVGALRAALRGVSGLRREGSVVVNLLPTGPDLLLRTDGALTPQDRAALARFGADQGVPRIAWGRGERGEVEVAAQTGPARVGFGGRATAAPPGAFLQASAEGEAAILAAVLEAVPELVRELAPGRVGKGGVLELYAGCGTLTHGLAERGAVTAYEGDAEAAEALRRAGNPRVTVHRRDLVRQPLQAAEVKAALAVLDPPFAGAGAQMEGLARSGVPVIYVSCNPAALERDGRVLVEAGYRVVSAAAIDQFLWSARVEAVVAFAPPGRGGRHGRPLPR